MSEIQPSVCVAIPCFNGEKELAITLSSILAQHYKNINILIANDGSTDNSLTIMHAFSERHNNITVLDLPRSNASKTRNTMLQNIDFNDFWCWCDCGDELLPNALSLLVAHALNLQKETKNIKVAVLPNKYIRSENSKEYRTNMTSLGMGLTAMKRHLTFFNPFSLHQGGLISKQAIIDATQNGMLLYEKNQQNGPDFLAGTKLIASGCVFSCIEKPLTIYNLNTNTCELGVQQKKISARYPDFVQGMKNHLCYFDQFIMSDNFKNNSLGCHFFRRSIALKNEDEFLLANDAMKHALSFTPWAKRIAYLASHCPTVDHVVRLFEKIDSSSSPDIIIPFMNTDLVLSKSFNLLRRIITHGEYENTLITLCKKIVEELNISIFFDLGAGLGIYSAVIGNHDKSIDIYAFEPTPAHFILLTKTIAVNKLQTQVSSFQLGVANTNRRISLAIAEEFGGANRIVDRQPSSQSFELPEIHGGGNMVYYNRVEEIEVVSLDSMFTLTNKIIYLKIDIEGAEESALSGAESLLTKNQCVLQVEVSPHLQAHLVSKLQQMGFVHFITLHRDMFFCSLPLIEHVKKLINNPYTSYDN